MKNHSFYCDSVDLLQFKLVIKFLHYVQDSELFTHTSLRHTSYSGLAVTLLKRNLKHGMISYEEIRRTVMLGIFAVTVSKISRRKIFSNRYLDTERNNFQLSLISTGCNSVGSFK